jgi:hypothetical protein
VKPLTPRLLAKRLTELPACCKADAAAHRAAIDNEYSVTSLPRRRRSAETTATTEVTTDAGTADSQPEDEAAEPYGRPLDADVLISTGVLGLAAEPRPARLPCGRRGTGRYLAGPPSDIWDYAILDANFTADDPILVIDGWQLVSPSSEDLRRLLPLPSTCDYQPNRPFKPQDYGNHASPYP